MQCSLPLRSVPCHGSSPAAAARAAEPFIHQTGARLSVSRLQAMHETNALHRPAPPAKTLHSFFYFDPQDPEHLVEEAGTSQKALVMQQEVMAQLEHTRGKVLELQQFESSSREWRMRAQQAAAELVLFQRTLADKDAELASAYKRLESAAAERSALRKLNLSLDEEARSLKGIMDEVRLLEAANLTEKGGPAGVRAAAPAQAGEGAGKAADSAPGGVGQGSGGKSSSGSNNGKVAGVKK